MRTSASSTLLALTALLSVAASVDAQVSAFELDTLMVRAVSRLPGGAAGRSVTLIDREALLGQPVSTVSEALRWALGVDLQIRSPAQSDLSLRGSSYEGVLVLVDGVRMSDPQTGHFDLDLTVPIERVERIEVLLGPASAQFGADAVGGVVNIVTRRGATDVAIRTETGSFGRWAVAGSGNIARDTWDLGFGAEVSESDGHREGTDYEIVLLDGHVARQAGAGRLSLSVGHARRDFGAADFYGPFPAYEATRTTAATAQWTGDLGRIGLTPRFSYRRHTDDFILIRTDPSVYRNNHVSDQIGGDLVARVSLGGEAESVIGSEWTRETLDSNNLGQRAQDRVAAFGEVTAAFGTLRSNFGLRLDHRTDFDVFISPSASLSVPVTSRLSVRGQIGRAFRTPTWTERHYEDPANVGTPDLDAERSWTVEVGADLLLPREGLARATLFRRTSESLIDWAKPESDPTAKWQTRNVESATFDGLELSGGVRLVGNLSATATANWLELSTSEARGFTSKSTLRPIVRAFRLSFEHGGPQGVRLRLDLLDRTRQDEVGVFLVEARVGVPLWVGEVYLAGTNLTDATSLDLSGLPAQGRAFTVGLRSRLPR